MKPKLTYTWPTEADAQELIDSARVSDKAEIWALSRGSIEAAVRESLRRPGPRWTVRQPDGGLVCIFGFSELNILGNSAAPWCIGTPRMKEEARELVEMTTHASHAAAHVYDKLWNVVWAKNTRSIRYLKACGYTVHQVQHTREGVPYHEFSMEHIHV